jgi:hypothetical protein
MSTTTCFQTVLRNTSGRTLNIGFLRRGKILAIEEDFNYDGNPLDRLTRKRDRDAYTKLLLNTDLTVLSAPAAITYDATLHFPSVVGVDNGVAVVTDPCTGHYSSDS